jgi:hypothetical protein
MRITVKLRQLTTLPLILSVRLRQCLSLSPMSPPACLHEILFERVERDREESDAFHQKGDASDLE